MHVVRVQLGTDKEKLFDFGVLPRTAGLIMEGDAVLCDTRYGLTVGKVVDDDVQNSQVPESDLRLIAGIIDMQEYLNHLKETSKNGKKR